MRSTASLWRQILVSAAESPGAGGLRHAVHSASVSASSLSGARPARNVDHACFAAAALPLSSNRTATPHHLVSPRPIVPMSRANAFLRSAPVHEGCIVSPLPAATVACAVSAQLDTSTPPIGAYTSVPPPGPDSVAVDDAMSKLTVSPFAPGSSGFGAEPILKLWIEYALTGVPAPAFETLSSITIA